MGLYRKATPDELRGATVLKDEPPMRPIATLADVITSADDPRIVSKPGRPIVSTGDPKKDKRNASQRALMAKRRKKK